MTPRTTVSRFAHGCLAEPCRHVEGSPECGIVMLSESVIGRIGDPTMLDDVATIRSLFVRGQSGGAVSDVIAKDTGITLIVERNRYDASAIVVAAMAAFTAIGLEIEDIFRGTLRDRAPAAGCEPEAAAAARAAIVTGEDRIKTESLATIALALALSGAERWAAELFSRCATERLLAIGKTFEGADDVRVAVCGNDAPSFFRCFPHLARRVDIALGMRKRRRGEGGAVRLDVKPDPCPKCDCGITMIRYRSETDVGGGGHRNTPKQGGRFLCAVTVMSAECGCRTIAVSASERHR